MGAPLHSARTAANDAQGISMTTMEERPSHAVLAYLAGWPGGMLPRGTPGAVSAWT